MLISTMFIANFIDANIILRSAFSYIAAALYTDLSVKKSFPSQEGLFFLQTGPTIVD